MQGRHRRSDISAVAQCSAAACMRVGSLAFALSVGLVALLPACRQLIRAQSALIMSVQDGKCAVYRHSAMHLFMVLLHECVQTRAYSHSWDLCDQRGRPRVCLPLQSSLSEEACGACRQSRRIGRDALSRTSFQPNDSTRASLPIVQEVGPKLGTVTRRLSAMSALNFKARLSDFCSCASRCSERAHHNAQLQTTEQVVEVLQLYGAGARSVGCVCRSVRCRSASHLRAQP